LRFSFDQVVPGAPGVIVAALIDPAFLARLGELPKLGAPELLDQVRDGERVVQRVRHRFTGALSPAVTRVIDPAKVVWVEEATFDLAARTATFHIVPEHYAGKLRCTGTYTFTARGGSTVRHAAGDLTVRVPLVGRLVERAIVSGLEDHLRAEAALLQEWLEVNG
jgi:hypothetical protein